MYFLSGGCAPAVTPAHCIDPGLAESASFVVRW